VVLTEKYCIRLYRREKREERREKREERREKREERRENLKPQTQKKRLRRFLIFQCCCLS